MPRTPCSAVAGGIHTVIFVDVDGVLNVGIRDDVGGAPLLLSRTNVDQANKASGQQRSPSTQLCVDKIVAMCRQPLGQREEGTFEALIADGDLQISDLLLRRLATIIKAAEAKGKTSVVLSSSWRHPKHVQRVRCLEQALGRHMGQQFSFGARTQQMAEKKPEDRLQTVGNFVARMPVVAGEHLRVLVLDDFFSYPLNSIASIENSLRMRRPVTSNTVVKLVHTFDEWTTPSGLLMQVGVGLTNTFLDQALDFVEKDTSPRYCDASFANSSLLSSGRLDTFSSQSNLNTFVSQSTEATATDVSISPRKRKQAPKIWDLKSRCNVDDAKSWKSPLAEGSPVGVLNEADLHRLRWIERVTAALPWVTGCSFGGF